MFFKSNVTISTMLIFALVLLLGCEGKAMENTKVNFSSIRDVSQEEWDKLAQKKIYFGHQSVGFNIIDGIKDVMKENPQIKLNIVETSDPADFNVPLFAHSRVGKNMDPGSKCDAFAGFMENGLGEKADIAFFKFCYVDTPPGVDIKNIFSKYKRTMSSLGKKYPKNKFVHVTMPLMTVQTGIKAWIKKIIGKSIGGHDANIRRNQFNEMLREEFGGKSPVFDLAKIESAYPNGTREEFQKDGKTFSAMVPDYTYDGGHLNESGRKIAAEQLLTFLANLSE